MQNVEGNQAEAHTKSPQAMSTPELLKDSVVGHLEFARQYAVPILAAAALAIAGALGIKALGADNWLDQSGTHPKPTHVQPRHHKHQPPQPH